MFPTAIGLVGEEDPHFPTPLFLLVTTEPREGEERLDGDRQGERNRKEERPVDEWIGRDVVLGDAVEQIIVPRVRVHGEEVASRAESFLGHHGAGSPFESLNLKNGEIAYV